MKRALICGVSGQDGAYLAKLLLDKGYAVFGTSRDARSAAFTNLRRLGIYERLTLESMPPDNFQSVLQVMDRFGPDEVFNLAGPSSVGMSFGRPAETISSISMGTLNLLEAIRLRAAPTRFFNASSGECFGDTGEGCANESAPFRPRSPYAVAKAASFWQVENYRDAYGLYACNGILFNHESPLRSESFVTQKVVAAAHRIASGSGETLRLGNLGVHRDWGWAPEYVDAMWRVLQQKGPDDYVISTGESNSLEAFVMAVFDSYGMDWREYVNIDRSLFRPSEVIRSCGNPAKAKKQLRWSARCRMRDVVKLLVHAKQR